MNRWRLLTLALVVSLSALALAGCSIEATKTVGSGTTLVERYELDNFDRISVSGALVVDVTVGEASAVSVTVDDNLVDKLEVRVVDGELRFDIKDGVSIEQATLRGTVELPTLVGMELSGASSAVVRNVSGPSHSFIVSGASDVVVNGDSGDLTADVGGASVLTFRGTVKTLALEASGSSSVKIDASGLSTASIDAGGASDVSLLSAQTVTGDLSGSSLLAAPRAATIMVETSGSSSIARS